MKKILIISLIVLSACTDATRAQFGAIGSRGSITCYSGGQVVYKGESSGKIQTEQGSDGWFFKDDSTGKLIRTNADCVIQN